MDRVPKWGGAAKAAPSSFIVENGKWKVESWGAVRRDRGVGDAAPYGGQESAAVVERRHTWVPPYGEIINYA